MRIAELGHFHWRSMGTGPERQLGADCNQGALEMRHWQLLAVDQHYIFVAVASS